MKTGESKLITHLVLGGGGMSMITILGVLRYLRQEGLDRGIRHIAGTSMGAFFAFLFACRLSDAEMERLLTDIFTDPEILCFDIGSIFEFPTRWGLADPTTRVLKRLPAAMKTITFRELAKTHGVHLVVCATCLETGAATYFSVETSGDLPVATAVCASMSLPPIFAPVVIGDRTYTDGGFTDPVPLRPFRHLATAAEQVFIVKRNRPLCASQLRSIENGLDYVMRLVGILADNVEFRELTSIEASAFADSTLNIDTPLPPVRCVLNRDGIVINTTAADIEASLAAGYYAAQLYFKRFLTSASSASDVRSPS